MESTRRALASRPHRLLLDADAHDAYAEAAIDWTSEAARNVAEHGWDHDTAEADAADWGSDE